MTDDTLRRGFDALAAIGALRQEPSPPSAGPVQDEPFPTYAWEFGDRDGDHYWVRVMAAWRKIAAHKHLPGAMAWTARFHPDLHRRATRELSAEWERLWDEAAPLDEFQAVLNRWVQAHEELIGLFPVTRGTE